VEVIEDDFSPTYECTQCSSKDDSKSQRFFASRRAWLWAPLPRLVTVQLKRFHRRGQRFEKSSAKVETPAVLDLGAFLMTEAEHSQLKPHLAPDAELGKPSDSACSGLYELYGVCVHIGSTMHGGHYIAYVNTGSSLEKEEWYNVSDSHVSKCSRTDALQAEAYVAFYRQADLLLATGSAPNDESDKAVDDGDAGGNTSEESFM